MISQEELMPSRYTRRQDPALVDRASKGNAVSAAFMEAWASVVMGPTRAARRANERAARRAKSDGPRGGRGRPTTPERHVRHGDPGALGRAEPTQFGMFKWFLANGNGNGERFPDVAKPLRAGFEERRGDDIRAGEESTRGRP
ncbi:hypothetical protein Q5P01_000223 [Channa striata]|uniref:Uncharacterized protein n=1 Tax=Channa striata TaxID=64152 RepID=A0AA88LLY5_CHASR|nr:hypothetical protein Q5P01_000223 [Channa striata]